MTSLFGPGRRVLKRHLVLILVVVVVVVVISSLKISSLRLS